MKQFILCLLVALTFCSCSDKLTESKIRTILKDYFTNDDLNSTTSFQIGSISYLSDTDIENYRKLEEDGLLKIEKQQNNAYNVSLTHKSNTFVTETYIKENVDKYSMMFGPMSSFGKVEKESYAKVITYTYDVDTIEDIHENPSDNTATARITFRKINKTPFFILLKDKTDFTKKKFKFFKTTDGDWKLIKNE